MNTRHLIAKLSALAARGAIVRGLGEPKRFVACMHPGEGSA
ncbi:hypothetical protein PEC18_29245 [Paucibacter sp. O1-1]|nr:hypothetical protein [Paucibacter sp. O1-1]MDA3829826.1 hypothetical protein [Paucibacter sp. O1-1]